MKNYLKIFIPLFLLAFSLEGFSKKIEVNLTTSGTLSQFTTSDEALNADSIIVTGGATLTSEDFLAIKKLLVSYKLVYVDIYETANSSIGNRVFYGCERLVGFRFPKSLTSIGEYCFERCYNLKNIYLPNTLRSFGTGVFRSCGLEKVTIPSSVFRLEDQTFYYCPLTDVYSECTTPPSCNVSAFIAGSSQITNTILHVPVGTKTLYENADGWMYFTNIVETLNNFYKVYAYTSGNGSIFVNGSAINNSYINIEEDSKVTFDFAPDDGFEVSSVWLNNEDITENITNNHYVINSIKGELYIQVEFKRIEFGLSIKSADNGSITLSVEKGKSYSFTIIPSEGWEIESISFNGANVTSNIMNNIYTTPAIFSNSELNIIYKQNGQSAIKMANKDSQLTLSASSGTLRIENKGNQCNVSIYTFNGSSVLSEKIGTGTKLIELPIQNVYIIKIGKEIYKVFM